MTPSPFDTDLCYGYVTSRGSHQVVAFIKCLILRRMQQIVNTNRSRQKHSNWAGNLLSLPTSFLTFIKKSQIQNQI